MNRKLLALAVGAALSLPMAAQATPVIYGLLNMSVDKVDLESVDTAPLIPGIQALDNFQVNSNSSRVGLMGEESFGNGLSAVYKAEWGVAGDMAGTTDLTGRDRYLGLQGAFGTFKLGAYDSPLKTSQGTVDQFNDMNYLDMGNFLAGEVRMNNLIGYESPKIADAITIKVALQPGETNANDGLAEAFSASAAFETGGLYLALGVDSDVNNDPNAAPGNVPGSYNPGVGEGMDTIRLTGTYTVGGLQLGALLQSSEVSHEGPAPGVKDDQKAVLLSTAYAFGSNTVKGQIIVVNDDFGGTGPGSELDTQVVEVGYDHNFTQMSKAYGQVGWATYDAGGPDMDDTVVSIGMQTKF